jgi:hypothetical protein
MHIKGGSPCEYPHTVSVDGAVDGGLGIVAVEEVGMPELPPLVTQ